MSGMKMRYKTGLNETLSNAISRPNCTNRQVLLAIAIGYAAWMQNSSVSHPDPRPAKMANLAAELLIPNHPLPVLLTNRAPHAEGTIDGVQPITTTSTCKATLFPRSPRFEALPLQTSVAPLRFPPLVSKTGPRH